MDCSPPGSSVHGISQARILEGVAISFSRGSSWLRSPALQADSLPLSHLGSPVIIPALQQGNWLRESDFPKALALAVPKHEPLLLSPLCLQFYQGAKPPGAAEIVTRNGFLKWDLGPEHDWNLSILSILLLVSSIRCLYVVGGFILKRQTMFV